MTEPGEKARVNSLCETREGPGRPFQPGQVTNPAGRPKGARNRLTQRFFEDLLADWEGHGADAMKRFRDERPHEYVKVVAGLLPKYYNVKVNELDELSDDQIRAEFNALVARVAAASTDAGGGDGEATAAEPPLSLPSLR